MSVTDLPYALPACGSRAEGSGASGAAPSSDRRPRRLRLIAAAAAVALVAGIGADFLAFARVVAEASPPTDARADGIVVLTGGAERIPSGLELLAAGRAERLLISGVNPKTAESTLLKSKPALAAKKSCCIEVGREAADTIGNAAEARKWALANNLQSLVVVTSAYHIPRSLAEFADALPDRKLIAYPVVRPELKLDAWYREPEAARLLAAEYLKYVLVRVRLGLERVGLGTQPEGRRSESL